MRASRVVMVSPRGFGFDPETAASNAFQTSGEFDVSAVHREFKDAVEALRGCGIRADVLDPDEDLFNGVFPNNWFSTHPDGRLNLYPMGTPSRRGERRLLPKLLQAIGPRSVVDLTDGESSGEILEGTGSLVLDHERRLGFACLSPRTSAGAARRVCHDLGYGCFLFSAQLDGLEIYHTNVLMAVGPSLAVVCPEVVDRGEELLDLLGGREVVKIDERQLRSFCGNVIELESRTGEAVFVMSSTAHAAFSPGQLDRFLAYGSICSVEIPKIEAIGGGSARCMVAEVFEGG